jgi:hypothetical protein
MKVHALETGKSVQTSLLMKCQVLKQKQLIFTYIDKESGTRIAQNAPLVSSINLHKVHDRTQYFVDLKSDIVMSDVCRQKMSFISKEKMTALDSDVF